MPPLGRVGYGASLEGLVRIVPFALNMAYPYFPPSGLILMMLVMLVP